MPFTISVEEVFETTRMILFDKLDIRAVTLGVNLKDCLGGGETQVLEAVRRKIVGLARALVEESRALETRHGIPIVNKRLSITPAAWLIEGRSPGFGLELARCLDQAAAEAGVDFVGGYGALVDRGLTSAAERLLKGLPEVMAATERVCAFANLASSRSGLNLDGLALMGRILKDVAAATEQAAGCAKIVCFANAPNDNPFMAGAFHGPGQGEAALNVGVSGPGVVAAVVEEHPDYDLGALSELIKRTAFKITRVGEMIGRELAAALGVPFGVVDLSLAPTPRVVDSVARILEAMGVDRVGGPGSTLAVALLVDAVKKGGAMASGSVGGLSGTFLPISEDLGMAEAVAAGALCLEKLEAMTAVCSVGLDMVALPGDTPAETLAAIMADELTIGLINHKTTATRLIPVPGKKAGEWVEWGGLFGKSPILAVSRVSPARLIGRGGRMPAPLTSLRN